MANTCLFQGYIPPTLDEVKKYADSYYAHWEDRSTWLIRRVKQFEPISPVANKIKMSYDVMFSELSKLEHRHGVLTLPLDWMNKQPFVSIDISGPWESAVCLASRSESARIATYYVFGWLNRFAKFSLHELTEEQVSAVYRLLRGRDTSAHGRLSSWLYIVEKYDLNWPIGSSNNWYAWIANREFRHFFTNLCKTFAMSVTLPYKQLETCARGIIKVSWNDSFTYQHDDFFEGYIRQSSQEISARIEASLTPVHFLLFRAMVIAFIGIVILTNWLRSQMRRYGVVPPNFVISLVSESKLGFYGQIVLPEAMRIDNVRCETLRIDGEAQEITVKPSGYMHKDDGMKAGDLHYVGNKARLYITRGEGVNLSADFRIQAHVKRGQFVLPALFASLAGLAVSAVLLPMFIKFENFAFPQDISSMVAVVAILPSAMAGYILFDREHEYVSVVLGSRRVLLVVSMIVTLTAVFTVNLALVLRSGIPHEDKPTPQTLAYIHRLSDTAEVAAFVTFATHLVAFLVFALDFLVTENWRHTFSRKFHLALAWIYSALLLCCFLCAYCWMGVSLFHWHGAKTNFFAELPRILYHQARIVWQSV